MRVRRVRYGPMYEREDDNPYRDKSKPPRKFWHNDHEVAVYEDADIRQLDHNHHFPGTRYQLRIKGIPDPETGTDTDVDGDTAVIRVMMLGGTVTFYRTDRPTFSGFVSKEDLAYEERYRAGDQADGSIGTYRYEEADDALDYEFVREEWRVIG